MSALKSTCIALGNSESNGCLNEEVSDFNHVVDANGDFYNEKVEQNIEGSWDEDIASSSSKDETEEIIIHLKTR